MAEPDASRILQVVASFTQRSLQHTSVTDTLYDLALTTAELLGRAGAGTSLPQNGTLQFVSATSELVTHLEQAQATYGEGACHEAFQSGEVVPVTDLAADRRWPRYTAEALSCGVHAVMGVPMRVGDRSVGSLDVYDLEPVAWTDLDMLIARLMADIAGSQVLRTEEVGQAKRLAEQLQSALEGRGFIEQAKGLLAGERGVPLNEAFEMLRRHARRNRASLHSVARAVVQLGLRPEDQPPKR